MADFRSGAQNKQDKPRTSCHIRIKTINDNQGHVEKTQELM